MAELIKQTEIINFLVELQNYVISLLSNDKYFIQHELSYFCQINA